MAVSEFGQENGTAAGSNEISSYNLLVAVIGSLYQHIRPYRFDQRLGCFLIEEKMAQTPLIAPTTSARDASVCTGRPEPFNRRTEASLLRAITSRSQASAACRTRDTCPGWRRSKQPFAKPITRPRLCQ